MLPSHTDRNNKVILALFQDNLTNNLQLVQGQFRIMQQLNWNHDKDYYLSLVARSTVGLSGWPHYFCPLSGQPDHTKIM